MIKTELSSQDLCCLNLARLMNFYKSMSATSAKQLGDHGFKKVIVRLHFATSFMQAFGNRAESK